MALGTLPFLVTIWLVVVLGAKVLEESGGKIAAALKGAPAAPSFSRSRLRIRLAAQPARPAAPRLRAAA
jgi:hypothetical protein